MLQLQVILLLNIIKEKIQYSVNILIRNIFNTSYRTLENIAFLNRLINRSVILDKFIVYNQQQQTANSFTDVNV